MPFENNLRTSLKYIDRSDTPWAKRANCQRNKSRIFRAKNERFEIEVIFSNWKTLLVAFSVIFVFSFVLVLSIRKTVPLFLRWFRTINCRVCFVYWLKIENKANEQWFHIKQLQWTMLAISARHRVAAAIWEWVWAWVSAVQHSHIHGWCPRKIYAPFHTNKCQINIKILLCIRSRLLNLGTCLIFRNL